MSAPPPTQPPVSSTPGDVAPSGKRVILWLFVLLALATFVTLVLFANSVPQQFRPRIYASMVGDLMIPAIAWQAFRLIEQRRHADG